MNQPNIMQMVAKIKTLKEFDELVFLVPTASAASTISKTIIFVNNLDDEMTLVYHLCNLFFTHMKNDKERIIKTFTLVLEPDAKEEYLKDFCNGDIRIWIYMNTVKMGVDIKNVVWVVQ